VGDVLNGLQLSQDANELSANQMALIIPLQTLSSLPRVCQGRFQHFLTKISTHLAKFSGTYFQSLSQQACSLFAAVHTSSLGPLLEMAYFPTRTLTAPIAVLAQRHARDMKQY
jgi:hypothetical protein